MLMMLWRTTRRRTKAALRSDKSVLDFALSTMVITTLWVMCDWFELGLDVDDRIDFWVWMGLAWRAMLWTFAFLYIRWLRFWIFNIAATDERRHGGSVLERDEYYDNIFGFGTKDYNNIPVFYNSRIVQEEGTIAF
ncbi:hypothetical protein FCV25MIE_01339 [Fagus crenata]